MKIMELIRRYPIQFLIWNVNEDTEIFWSDISTLEDNGFYEPWHQRIDLRSAKRVLNSFGDIVEYRLWVEYQGLPVELVIMND